MTTILSIHHFGHQACMNRTDMGSPSAFSTSGKGSSRSNVRIIMMSRALAGELMSAGMRLVNLNPYLCEKSVPYGKEGLFRVAMR